MLTHTVLTRPATNRPAQQNRTVCAHGTHAHQQPRQPSPVLTCQLFRLAGRSHTLTHPKTGLSWPGPTVSLIAGSQTSYPTHWFAWLKVCWCHTCTQAHAQVGPYHNWP